MKRHNKVCQHHGFRKPKKPIVYECKDGVTRIAHGVSIEKREWEYAVNIAALKDVSLSYYFSTLLKEAIDRDVTAFLESQAK